MQFHNMTEILVILVLIRLLCKNTGYNKIQLQNITKCLLPWLKYKDYQHEYYRIILTFYRKRQMNFYISLTLTQNIDFMAYFLFTMTHKHIKVLVIIYLKVVLFLPTTCNNFSWYEWIKVDSQFTPPPTLK